MRLQQKALVVTLPLILIPTLILGALAYFYTMEAQVQIENAKLRENISFRKVAIENYVKNARSGLEYLSYHNDIQLLRAQIDQELPYRLVQEFLLSSFRDFISAYPETESVYLYYPDGDPIFGFPSTPPDELLDVGAIANNWRITLDGEEQQQYIEIIHPLYIYQSDTQQDQNIWAYIQIRLLPDWNQLLELNHFYQGADQHDSELTFLLANMQGQILFSSLQGDKGTELPQHLFNRFRKLSEMQQSADVYYGSDKIYFVSSLLEDKYLLLYGENEVDILHEKTNITWLTGVTLIASLFVAPILLFFSFNYLVIGPIAKLAAAKQKVAQGNLDIKLDVESRDEFGELFAAFNVMVRQLVVYRQNERESRLKLEYKVRERTEELEATNFALSKSNKALEHAKELSEQANELKSAFVANISHEIRTPLTAILGFTEEVIGQLPADDEQHKLLLRVKNSGQHLLALINDILDLSKIESDKLEMDINQHDLCEICIEVAHILTSQANSKNLEFEFRPQYPLPKYTRTDKTRLQQILLNLASNAIKFTEQGFVHFDVRFIEKANQVEVSIIDSGIGMSEEVLQRIFAPFVQADVSISRKFGGTGLGLVISKRLANMLGGDIRVLSDEGKGSEFIMTFDLNSDGKTLSNQVIHSDKELNYELQKASQESQVDETEQPLSGKVLVAEDVEDNQHLFTLLLDAIEVEYQIVENGEQALEAALLEDFDLILMDMQMPVMGGLEATLLMRQSGLDTPIYALTANVMKEDLERHKEAGCDGTVAKPIEKAEFMRVIRRHLSSVESDVDQILIPDEQMAELKQNYLKQMVVQKMDISRALKQKATNELRSECHKVKGTAGSYGYLLLSQTAADIEKQLLNGGEWQQVAIDVSILLQHMEKIIDTDLENRL